jgi:hypothetical protein
LKELTQFAELSGTPQCVCSYKRRNHHFLIVITITAIAASRSRVTPINSGIIVDGRFAGVGASCVAIGAGTGSASGSGGRG